MTPLPASSFKWRAAACLFGAVAVVGFGAAAFLLLSDDFVIGGRVVPAADARIVRWRNLAAQAGVAATILAACCRRRAI